MITGAICMSHSPLMDKNRAVADVESAFYGAVDSAGRFAAESKPSLAVVFFPDHLNGFFYNLMPAFCVGAKGASIGDFGTVPGELDIPETLAVDLASFCLKAGVDVALSFKMSVDHGAVQPLELLAGSGGLLPIIPIFINCAAAPRPSFARTRALGEAVGRWAESRPERILLVASGGLSHDPPLPSLKTASPEVRARLINGGASTHAERTARQKRVEGEGQKYLAGTSTVRPINPDWDRDLLDAFARGDLTTLDAAGEDAITETAGCGAHEVRSWVAALAAARAAPAHKPEIMFYAAVPEWITGMGIMKASVSR